MPIGTRTRLAVLLVFRGLVAFPLLGALAGSLIAFALELDFAVLVGSLYSAVPGLVFGLLILWPTRDDSLWRIALYTVPGTVSFGVVGFWLPEKEKWIPQILLGVYFYLPASLGFWFGVILLYILRPPRGNEK
jgi:hypothetical protein